MVPSFLEMIHLELCEHQSWDVAYEEVPCMDDARNPPKDPESNIYPDICFNVQVRGQCMRLDENVSSIQYLHGIRSLIKM
jgi:hypothetical protein